MMADGRRCTTNYYLSPKYNTMNSNATTAAATNNNNTNISIINSSSSSSSNHPTLGPPTIREYDHILLHFADNRQIFAQAVPKHKRPGIGASGGGGIGGGVGGAGAGVAVRRRAHPRPHRRALGRAGTARADRAHHQRRSGH